MVGRTISPLYSTRSFNHSVVEMTTSAAEEEEEEEMTADCKFLIFNYCAASVDVLEAPVYFIAAVPPFLVIAGHDGGDDDDESWH